MQNLFLSNWKSQQPYTNGKNYTTLQILNGNIYIFKLPYIVARETSLQSLQYKILNRYIPCYENLHRWGKEPNDKCLHCGKTDTIEPFLFSCPDLKVYWSTFNDWLYNTQSFSTNIFKLEVIFGVPNEFNDIGLHTFACC